MLVDSPWSKDLDNHWTDFCDFLHEVIRQEVKKSNRAGFLKKNLGVEILGQKGSKMSFFEIFSKTALTIWFIFIQKEDIIVLHVCAKFQVRINFRSQNMGSKGVKNGVF